MLCPGANDRRHAPHMRLLTESQRKGTVMSRPVKELIVDEYKRRFADVDDALVVDIRGIDANENNTLRLGLGEKSIRITVVKNTLARKALEGTSLAPLTSVLDGPAAIAYGADSVIDVARELVAWARKVQHLEQRGPQILCSQPNSVPKRGSCGKFLGTQAVYDCGTPPI